MTTFFTSDLHLGHARVIEYSKRPFKDVHEMDETLIANWNAVVRPHDTVFVVGDLSFHKAQQTLGIVRRLNGQIGLILGIRTGACRTIRIRSPSTSAWIVTTTGPSATKR